MWAIAIAVAALYTSTEAEIYYQMPFVMPRPFLDKLPWRAASEFYGLIAARNITHRATRQKVQEWGEKYGVKEEMNKFYNKYQKNEEERGKKAIALLENAAKAYREYLALHDDTKTPEQIGADEKKMRYQIPKKEVEEFYNENNKRGEERKKKVIAILDNAPKAYREYLALFDDTKTLEQIDEDEKKMHAEKPEEYNVVMYTNALARDYYYGIYRRNKPAVYYNPI